MAINNLQVDPSVAIPFWDFTLDANLPNPADSCIFADEFIGQMSEEHDHATNLSVIKFLDNKFVYS